MSTFEKGMDYSNYQPNNSADFLVYMRDEHGVQFVRLGAQDAGITRQQLNWCREVGMPVDALYVTSMFQVDGARQLAREFGIPRIYPDVEPDCITERSELEAVLNVITSEFLSGIYTRVLYWTENFADFDIHRWPNMDAWIAYYVESWYQNGPSGQNIDFLMHAAGQAGLWPLSCVQYTNTLEPMQGKQCCLDARIVTVAAEPGPHDIPASNGPGPVENSDEREPDMTAPTPTPQPPTGPQPPSAWPGNPAPVQDRPETPWNERDNAGPEEGFTAPSRPDADDGFEYMRHADVPVLRFGGTERGEDGRNLYPGRIAFRRHGIETPTDENPSGDGWLWLRVAADGNLFLSREEGD